MDGLMMDCPLLIPDILRRAARFYPDKEIVSRFEDETLHRSNYGELYRRVVRLMNALRGLGIGPGDRVATFAWNHRRHLELYFAVPSLGAVLHTVNIRLHRDQLQADLPTVERYILMDERGPEPAALPGPATDYEELLEGASPREDFPAL